MDTRGFLDRLLGEGKSLLGQTGLTNPEGKISDYGKGALSAGALGILLGSKRGRKLATYGGLAALGMVAWRAYNQGRAGQQEEAPPASFDDSRGASRVVLRAMLAAARADGQIDDGERARIDQEIERLGGDAQLRAWVEAELQAALDPQGIAAEVAGDALLASEVYLASALVIGEATFLERAYLDRLADCLGLDPDLKQRLEEQAQAA